MKRRGFTIVELIAVIAVISILAAFLLTATKKARDNACRVSCANTLKQLGICLKMYAKESTGQSFPTMKYAGGDDCTDLVAGEFFFQGDQLYPKYLKDVALLACPAEQNWHDRVHREYSSSDLKRTCPCKFDAHSYFYTGWMIQPEDYIKPGANPAAPSGKSLNNAFVNALTNLIARQRAATNITEAFAIVDTDIQIEKQSWPKLCRLREGVERFLITDINGPAAGALIYQSFVPVLWDVVHVNPQDFNHGPPGGNILFMDGHVEFQRYSFSNNSGQRGPVNPTWAYLIQTLK